MLTPKRYWRIARSLEALKQPPEEWVQMPACIAAQKAPPVPGDGVLLADFDATTEQGLVRYLGIVRGVQRGGIAADWVPTERQIWVDTGPGRGFWSGREGFCFAERKVAGYGLHAVFAESFPDLTARETLPDEVRVARGPRRSKLAPDRTTPIEVIGEATPAPRGGYVYVLRSAFGFKVGRAKSMDDRMKLFAVKLPFLYTIPLCAWFDDYIEAEGRYHRLFSATRLQGEWFALEESDLDLIRQRRFET